MCNSVEYAHYDVQVYMMTCVCGCASVRSKSIYTCTCTCSTHCHKSCHLNTQGYCRPHAQGDNQNTGQWGLKMAAYIQCTTYVHTVLYHCQGTFPS